MKNIIIIVGIAALAAATPALADRGHNKGPKSKQHNGKHHDSRQGWGTYGAWGNNCPPGLRKKNNGCLPPGQARKRYNTGQRWSNGYGTAWSYNQVPYDYRQQYNLSANDRYYYRDGYIYQVDRRTNLVEQVLSALLR